MSQKKTTKKGLPESRIIIEETPPYASRELGDLFPPGHFNAGDPEIKLDKPEKMIYFPDEDLPEMPAKDKDLEIEGPDK